MQNDSLSTAHRWSLRTVCGLALLFTSANLVAQRVPQDPPVTGTASPQSGWVPATQHPTTGAEVDMPQPPRAFNPTLPKHGLPPVPDGDGTMPQPDSPESRVLPEPVPGVIDAPGDFRYWQNRVVKPTGASTSNVGEPSLTQHSNVVLQTGNWYAAQSEDNGRTWSYVNPYTRFGASDGGFCCDQRALFVPSQDMSIWLLQYSYSSTTQRGGQRIARTIGKAGMLGNSWTSWYFTPQNFGRPNGEWMDFPDIAYTTTHLWAASNMYNASSSYTGSVVWKIPLSELATGGSVSFQYWTNATIGSNSYRLVQNAGAQMFFAGHINTTTIRVYAHNVAANTLSWNDRTVPSWSGTSYTTPSPDGLGMGSRTDGRVLGAYLSGGEVGFMWGAPLNAGNGRAQPFVRVARFNTSDRTLINTQDIWSATLAFLYPAVAVNARGDKGCVMGYSSSSTYPTTASFIVDSYAPNFSGQTIFAMTTGTSGPSGSRFGDYFTVQRHPNYTNTFVATGMTQRGGSANGNSEPRYAWFSREEVQPAYVDLTVNSAPITGIPITVGHQDMNGLQNGTTNFTRAYAARQQYELTAPLTFTSGSTYVFHQWTGTASAPIDQRTLSVSDIGVVADTVTANYVIGRTLTVQSTNPGSGVSITVDTADVNGAQNGSTSFNRLYKTGQALTLTAPATAGGIAFKRWRLNGVAQAVGNRVLNLTLNANATAIADYYVLLAGSTTNIGSGCTGNTGVLTHTATGTLQIGNTITYRLTQGGLPSSIVTMALGTSTTNWNGIPLPFNLGILGATGCSVYVNHVVLFNAATNGSGAAALPITVPNNLSLVGFRFHTQYLAPTTQNRFGIATSNGLTTLVGGLQ